MLTGVSGGACDDDAPGTDGRALSEVGGAVSRGVLLGREALGRPGTEPAPAVEPFADAAEPDTAGPPDDELTDTCAWPSGCFDVVHAERAVRIARHAAPERTFKITRAAQ